MRHFLALLLGIAFGIVLIKGEIISWFRIQEMFMFHSFHMYGVIGSAVVVGAISIFLIKKFKVKNIHGEEIEIQPKPKTYKANFIGGAIFGLGWAFTGSCPAPLYAQVGYGNTVFIVAILSALFGVYIYGVFKDKLPH